MSISIVILIYNGEEYLSELIDSLAQTEWPPGEHELIFVDNASSDSSIQIVSDKLPFNGYLICQTENKGFAAGNNIGIRHALGSGADYVVLLNQDTVLQADWLKELLKAMDEKPQAGAIQSLLLYYNQKDTINSYGNYIHFLGFQYAGGNLKKISDCKSQIAGIREITYASGAAVMYKAEAIRKTGMLDEILESYHEDSDICLRLRLYGYQAYLAPKSVVYHKYGFLKSKVKSQKLKLRNFNYKYYLMERNRIYFILKYYSFKTSCLILPAWLLMEIGVFGFSVFRGFWPEKLKAYGWLLKNIRLVLVQRKKIKNIKKTKQLTDKALTKDFVGWIDYQEIKNPLLTYLANPLMKGYLIIIKLLI